MICAYNILMSAILLFKHALIFPLIYNHIIYYIYFYIIYSNAENVAMFPYYIYMYKYDIVKNYKKL